MTLAAALLLRLGGGTSTGYLLGCYVLFGVAFGLVNAPIANTAISGMPNSQAGVAASVASASRQTGSALGVAAAGSIIAGASSAGLASASHAAWALFAACGLAVAALGYVSTGRRALATADRVREMLADDGSQGTGDRHGQGGAPVPSGAGPAAPPGQGTSPARGRRERDRDAAIDR